MKWLSAGLTFVNVTTVCGCLEGIAAHGLSKTVAASSAIAGLVAALLAFWGTWEPPAQEQVAVPGVTPTDSTPERTPASAGSRHDQGATVVARPYQRYRWIWLAVVVAIFAMFAFRSFCNVFFIDGNEYKIQNPNNLGDLSLHITYIKTFANGVAMWPDNPIYVFSKLRYPAGIDLFNAILLCLNVSVIRGLVWVGLGASAALCYALYRWGGAFTIAGFLFNGGLAGFQWFRNYEWNDYQTSNYIAWKSLALTMLVTQRGLLYALPAGLLLLCHWRAKFFPTNKAATLPQDPSSSELGGLETDHGEAFSRTPSASEFGGSETDQGEALSQARSASAVDGSEIDQEETLSETPSASAVGALESDQEEALSPAPSASAVGALETDQEEALSHATSASAVGALEIDRGEALAETPSAPAVGALETPAPSSRGFLPFWVELSLYATMPLFHVHTFMALSFVLLFLFLFLGARARKQLFLLGALAFVPATFFLWLITDHFHAGSVLSWNPGWVQNNGDFARPLAAFTSQPNTVPAPGPGFLATLKHFFEFWVINFGITIPLIIALVVLLVARAWKQRDKLAAVNVRLTSIVAALALLAVVLGGLYAYLSLGYSLFVVLAIIPPVALALIIPLFASLLQHHWRRTIPLSTPLAFVIPAVVLFAFSCLVKTAPWEWDNIKLIIWSYLIVLPFVWSEIVSRWALPIRAIVCIALFGSGFLTLFGGMAAGRTGYGMIDRGELDAIGMAVSKIPIEARFAAHPTYNHPLLLQGRKLVFGYAGHIWTQGFNNGDDANKLTSLLNGAPDWKQTARYFNARYLFWGREEIKNYAQSKKPWEQECKLVASGPWGSIYDIESPKEPTPVVPGK